MESLQQEEQSLSDNEITNNTSVHFKKIKLRKSIINNDLYNSFNSLDSLNTEVKNYIFNEKENSIDKKINHSDNVQNKQQNKQQYNPKGNQQKISIEGTNHFILETSCLPKGLILTSFNNSP